MLGFFETLVCAFGLPQTRVRNAQPVVNIVLLGASEFAFAQIFRIHRRPLQQFHRFGKRLLHNLLFGKLNQRRDILRNHAPFPAFPRVEPAGFDQFERFLRLIRQIQQGNELHIEVVALKRACAMFR